MDRRPDSKMISNTPSGLTLRELEEQAEAREIAGFLIGKPAEKPAD